jgi:NADH-quinone oxidoreductase subunit M
LFANIAHGVVSALLFFLVGGLKERWGSANLATAHAALREVSPRLGIAMVVGFAASLGLPGLVGFWGEFLAMYSAWNPASDRPQTLMRVLVVVAVTGTAVAAGYSLRVLRLIWSGDRTTPAHPDARGGEWSVIAVLMTAVLVLGVAPGLVLNTTIKDVTAITEVSR